MAVRTDLAIELNEERENGAPGVEKETETDGDIRTTIIRITSQEGEKALGKQIGEYITVEFPSVLMINDFSCLKKCVIKALERLLKIDGTVLVAGLGNNDITPDAVGPETAKQILATRHIPTQLARDAGLGNLKSVAVISPGVLGKTGIEATELIKGAVDAVKPSAVIVVDALASKSVSRLFRTVQLCNTGISPGSGVKNSRKEISEKTLGVPVIALGVPTVVDAQTLAFELTGKVSAENIDMLVAPKDADLLCDRISEILSQSLNTFLQPEIDADILESLV